MILRREFLQSAMAAGAAVLAHQATPAAEADPLAQGCIDTHVHVWTPDTVSYPLKPGFSKTQMAPPSFTPEQLFAHSGPAGVQRTVLIQMSFYASDNSYMLDMIRTHPAVFSGVGIVEGHPKPRQAMLAMARQGVRGFRLPAVRQPPDQWLEGDLMAEVWKCAADHRLVICPLLTPAHLGSLGRMCRKFPQALVAVDHMARIGFDGQIRPAELDALCNLAQYPQVHVKMSAFYALGRKQAPYLDLAPMIRRLRDAFGADRLMWGSDSPFQVASPHTYRDSIDLIRSRLDFLSPAERRSMLQTTAQRLFF
jgi:predicted TIM-barrel fold metal-dependent hydrolase